MIEASELRARVKKDMGPIFTEAGFKYRYQSGGSIWYGWDENNEYMIGISMFIDTRDKAKPEFSFTLHVDPKDMLDIRAYRHSPWPPKGIRQAMGIRVSWIERAWNSYDAWIPFPEQADPVTLENYAKHLLEDLYSRIEKGKRWTRKTHRWQYDDK